MTNLTICYKQLCSCFLILSWMPIQWLWPDSCGADLRKRGFQRKSLLCFRFFPWGLSLSWLCTFTVWTPSHGSRSFPSIAFSVSSFPAHRKKRLLDLCSVLLLYVAEGMCVWGNYRGCLNKESQLCWSKSRSSLHLLKDFHDSSLMMFVNRPNVTKVGLKWLPGCGLQIWNFSDYGFCWDSQWNSIFCGSIT